MKLPAEETAATQGMAGHLSEPRAVHGVEDAQRQARAGQQLLQPRRVCGLPDAVGQALQAMEPRILHDPPLADEAINRVSDCEA